MECLPLVDLIKYSVVSITQDRLLIKILYPFVLLSHCSGTSEKIFIFFKTASKDLCKGKLSTMFLVHCF